jgi:hypothetical protein
MMLFVYKQCLKETSASMDGSQHSSLKKTHTSTVRWVQPAKNHKKVILIGGKTKKCYHAIATDAQK